MRFRFADPGIPLFLDLTKRLNSVFCFLNSVFDILAFRAPRSIPQSQSPLSETQRRPIDLRREARDSQPAHRQSVTRGKTRRRDHNSTT